MARGRRGRGGDVVSSCGAIVQLGLLVRLGVA
jgi:hypothetical protein